MKLLLTKRESIRSSEITPEHVYFSRRRVLRLGMLALGSAALAACAPTTPTAQEVPGMIPRLDKRDEFGDPVNRWEEITNYNNFYEFSTDKEAVARLAQGFQTTPWTITVDGLVRNPKTYDLDDLRKFGEEERIYRLRCVEGWSMVIPWLGFPLHKLLREVEPTAQARYVRFVSAFVPEQMPGTRLLPLYPWPYTEGLRLDEAMHDLTLLVTGVYGRPLPPQNGAPVRLAVPWKYGFKSIKSIVRIELVAEQPATLWNTVAPHEYGFYSNVNPNKPHPRWSQATERRIGELGRRRTLMFNGYMQVAPLYEGMDLMQNY